MTVRKAQTQSQRSVDAEQAEGPAHTLTLRPIFIFMKLVCVVSRMSPKLHTVMASTSASPTPAAHTNSALQHQLSPAASVGSAHDPCLACTLWTLAHLATLKQGRHHRQH